MRTRLLSGLIPLALAVGFGMVASPEAKATITVNVYVGATLIDTFDDAATPGTAINAVGGLTDTDGAGTTFTSLTISATGNAAAGPTT